MRPGECEGEERNHLFPSGMARFWLRVSHQGKLPAEQGAIAGDQLARIAPHISSLAHGGGMKH